MSNNNNRKSLWLILLLLLGLVGVGIFAFKQKQGLSDLTVQHEQLRKDFDAQLAELERVKAENTNLGDKLAEKDAEIAKLKKQIIPLINKKQLTPKEIIALKEKVNRLTKEVDGYKARIAELEQQVAVLRDSTSQLTVKNEQLETKKAELEQTVNQAAQIKAISLKTEFLKKVWFFGYTEKPTQNPSKVAKVTLSFFLQNNFLAEDGTKDIYVSVVQPDGQVLADKDLASGEVTLDGQTFKYTNKLVVNYDKKKSNEVVIKFEPDTLPLQEGNYEVVVYDQLGIIISDRTNFFFSLSKDAK